MRGYRGRDSLMPLGLVTDNVEIGPDKITATARSSSATAACPACDNISAQVHSRYQRCLADVPAHGRLVEIRLEVRRFRCRQRQCSTKIFGERLCEDITRPFGRRTSRLENLARHLGLALGGRPGQNLARRLLLPLSKDTLLRIVRLHASKTQCSPNVVGIDDWAWKRGHRYGTIICDLERRRVIDLLPDREMATVQAWLADRPSIRIISRDRGGGYGQAATRGQPEAIQVADRWHLMENASAAFLGAIRQTMRGIREQFRSGTIDPETLTCAELRQYENWRRREAINQDIVALATAGLSIKAIVRKTGHARAIVRQVLRGGRTDVFRPRFTSLDLLRTQLKAEWAQGCHSGAELWRRLRAAGYKGAPRVVSEWATRQRANEAAAVPRRPPAARVIARMLTIGRDQLSKSEAITATMIERASPALMIARNLMDRFHSLIPPRNGEGLNPWILDAKTSLLGSFCSGIIRDRNAVHAAITEPWSNGQSEGRINRLKLIKRQMYVWPCQTRRTARSADRCLINGRGPAPRLIQSQHWKRKRSHGWKRFDRLTA